jgi:hypothetical protein
VARGKMDDPGSGMAQMPERPPRGDGDPGPRGAWFRSSRLDAEGRLVGSAFVAASRQRRKIEFGGHVGKRPPPPSPPLAPPGVNWTPLGPSIINADFIESGRITAIAVGPGGTRVYAGAADGGVWISTDTGATWTPLDDYFTAPGSVPGGTPSDADSLSIGAIEVRFGATATADEIFVGTGEANLGAPTVNLGLDNPAAYFGVGIQHWVNGAWSLEATNLASQGIYRIVIDPNDATPTNIYAATTAGLFKRPTGGASPTTWNLVQVNPSKAALPATDIVAAGSGTDRMFYTAVNSDTVYSSPDGAVWTPLSGLGALPIHIWGRIALAASESDPNIIYAMVATGAFFRLDQSQGDIFEAVQNLPAKVPFSGGATGQGSYNIAIAVDPSDPNTVYLGGDAPSLYKGTISLSGGAPNFPAGGPAFVGAGVHPDVHALAFALNANGIGHDPSRVWVGCDGGVYQSSMSGAPGSFQNCNLGLAITQFYSFAQRSDTDAVVFAGAQDNGGPRFIGEQAALDTAQLVVGDGGCCVYHPSDPYRAFMQYKGTGLAATEDGGRTWSAVTSFPVPPPYTSPNPEGSQTSFIAPIAAVADAQAPGGALAAFGTDRLWLSADWGVTWVTLPSATNPYAQSLPDLTQDVIDPSASATVDTGATAIAFASTVQIYAATPHVLWRYDLTGGNWSNTILPTSSFPQGYRITAIAVEDATAGTIYVTLGGAGFPHVYYFDGAAWHAAMPTSVVDVPTHAIIVDPVTQDVYVGTDVGCWQGVRTGTNWSWSLFSNGLPQSAITLLAIHARARLLRASTMGRGVWEIPLDTTVGLDPDLYLRVNYADTGRVIGGSRHSWVEGAADPVNVTTPPLLVYHWMSADIKVRRTSLPNLPPLSTPVNYLDFAFNIGDYVQLSTDIETADVSGPDRIFVEVHNRSVNPVAASNVRVLLMVADASAGLPPLPSPIMGWASHINRGDVNPAWLAGSQWQFVDPSNPYRTPTGPVDVRTPQVVEYQFDFSSLGLSPGHDHVCLAAFVTTVDATDQITATNVDLNTVTMTDKHVAHRNTHLVALGAEPFIRPGGVGFFAINFNNSGDEAVSFDMVFDRSHFPGRIGLLLPPLAGLSHATAGLVEFRLEKYDGVLASVERELGEWIRRFGEFLEALGERIAGDLHSAPRPTPAVIEARERRHRALARLDRDHILVADAGTPPAIVSDVSIPARGSVTAAFTIQPPPGAKPKDRHRLDVIQRRAGRIVGGSSYIIAMV